MTEVQRIKKLHAIFQGLHQWFTSLMGGVHATETPGGRRGRREWRVETTAGPLFLICCDYFIGCCFEDPIKALDVARDFDQCSRNWDLAWFLSQRKLESEESVLEEFSRRFERCLRKILPSDQIATRGGSRT